MATLEEAQKGLDPPVEHDLTRKGNKVSLLLFDPLASAFAQRTAVPL